MLFDVFELVGLVGLVGLVVLAIFAPLVVLFGVLSTELAVIIAPAESSRLRVGDDEQPETRNIPIKNREIICCRDFFISRSNMNPRRVPIWQCARDVCVNVKLCN